MMTNSGIVISPIRSFSEVVPSPDISRGQAEINALWSDDFTDAELLSMPMDDGNTGK